MIRGIFASHSGIVGDRVNTLSSKILTSFWAGSVPLLALSAGMKEEKVSDISWSWIEDSHVSGNSAADATGYASGATTIGIVDSSIWVPNSILLVETTGEHMLVLSVPTNTSITVRRGFAGTTAAAIAANATMQLIGNAHEEGGSRPLAVSQAGASFMNLVQIFKNSWGITGTAAAVAYVTGSKIAENKAQCAQYHAEDIERAFLWGRKSTSSLNGKELRTSNGIIAQIEDYGGRVESANYNSVAGAMSMAGLQEFMRNVFQKSVKGLPNERIAFTSDWVLSLIQQMARKDTQYNLDVTDNEFGFNVLTLNFLGNKLKLMTHPLMSENAYWKKQLYVLHPGLISKRILRPLFTTDYNHDKANNNGEDSMSGTMTQEIGFQVKGAQLQGIMTNINSAAASI